MSRFVRFGVFGTVLGVLVAGLAIVSSASETPPDPVPCVRSSAFDAGERHSILTDPDGGLVFTFGSNRHGQLGTGADPTTSPTASRPSLVRLGRVIDVAAGARHSLALRADGTVWAWGDNSRGQLGDGTVTRRIAPVKVQLLTGIEAVSAGDDFSVARDRHGNVFAWGANDKGQLGNGSTTDSAVPTWVENFLAAEIEAGGSHVIARKANGEVHTWGANDRGQLGIGSIDGLAHPAPMRVAVPNTVDIAAGGAHSAVATNGSQIYTWGANHRGQLGLGTFTDTGAPTAVAHLLQPMAAVAAGRDHTVARAHSAYLYAWGANDAGQLGDKSRTDRRQPVELGRSAVGIAAGGRHTLFASANGDGRLEGTGSNAEGQLGDGGAADRTAMGVAGCRTANLPAIPQSLTATPGDRSAVLDWDQPNPSGSAPVSGYLVVDLYGNVVEHTPAPGSAVPSSVTITGLGYPSSHSFRVYALGGGTVGDSSDESPVVSPFGGPPAATEITYIERGDGRILLAWAAADGLGSPILSYTLTAQPGGATLTVGPNEREAWFEQLTVGESYRFTVHATNQFGAGALSTPTALILNSETADAPSGVTVISDGVVGPTGYATVEWTAPADPPEPITGFRLMARPVDGGDPIIHDVECMTSDSATLVGMTPGLTYEVSVAARNAVGIGEATSGGSVTPFPLTEAERQSRSLHTAGSGIYDAEGNRIRLRGVNVQWIDYILDPDDPRQQNIHEHLGKFKGWPRVESSCTPLRDDSIAEIAAWGANAVRVPISSSWWYPGDGEKADDPCGSIVGYKAEIDRTVAAITARGMVAMLDLHANRRLYCTTDGNFQQKMPDIGAIDFWRSVARRYKDEPLVAFELYNEPFDISGEVWLNGGEVDGGSLPLLEPEGWQAAGHQQLYDVIRAEGADQLVLANGLDLSRRFPEEDVWIDSLGLGVGPYLEKKRVRYVIRDADGSLGDNVVYATHHYEHGECHSTNMQQLEEWTAQANRELEPVPVIVTEFGRKCDDVSTTFVQDLIDYTDDDATCFSGWMAYRWSSAGDSERHDQNYPMLQGSDPQLPSYTPNNVGHVVKTALADQSKNVAGPCPLAEDADDE